MATQLPIKLNQVESAYDWENLGTFKLKDKSNMETIFLDFSKSPYAIEKAVGIHIRKVRNENNKFEIFVQWPKGVRDIK